MRSGKIFDDGDDGVCLQITTNSHSNIYKKKYITCEESINVKCT